MGGPTTEDPEHPHMRPRRFGIKIAQMGGSYDEMRDAWLEADRLGFDTGWLHDHLLNQNDIALPEDEGWTVKPMLVVRDPPRTPPVRFGHVSFLAPEVRVNQLRDVAVVSFNIFLLDPVLADIKKAIAERHGGRMALGAAPEGTGLAVSIVLPRITDVRQTRG